MKHDSSLKIVLPVGLSNEMTVEQTIFPTNSDEVGIAVLSHVENDTHIMRIYKLMRNHETTLFEPVLEMAAFSFKNKNDFNEFLEKLPKLTGLEMLLLLNPILPLHDDAHAH